MKQVLAESVATDTGAKTRLFSHEKGDYLAANSMVSEAALPWWRNS